MVKCDKCNNAILSGNLVRIVAKCYFVSPSIDGYGLDFVSQEYIEHDKCKEPKFLKIMWQKIKFWYTMRNIIK